MCAWFSRIGGILEINQLSSITKREYLPRNYSPPSAYYKQGEQNVFVYSGKQLW
jgi:hypothetical protein